MQGNRIAFVPTMGNLHAGHLKLITVAKAKADKVVVSIFINPTQFGQGEDFALYPRTQAEDEEKLRQIKADLLFLPSVDEIYPHGPATLVSVVQLRSLHCGASRPGHFDGVATVVTKLFNIVQADVSFFGIKDYQQLLLVRALVHDLNIPIEIVGVETQREIDGLAMSSRNGYLSNKERLIAPALYRLLCSAKEAVIDGKLSFRAIEQQAIDQISALGFKADYFIICRNKDLNVATEDDKNLAILVAAKLGVLRLIDNICFSL